MYEVWQLGWCFYAATVICGELVHVESCGYMIQEFASKMVSRTQVFVQVKWLQDGRKVITDNGSYGYLTLSRSDPSVEKVTEMVTWSSICCLEVSRKLDVNRGIAGLILTQWEISGANLKLGGLTPAQTLG